MGCCSFFFFLFQSGLVSRSGCFSTSLRKHPFLLALRRWERFARENVTFFRAKRFSACSAEVRSQQSLSKFLHNEQMVAVHKSNPPRTCVYEQYGFTTFLCYEMKLCFLVTLTRSVKRDFWKKYARSNEFVSRKVEAVSTALKCIRGRSLWRCRL